MDAKVLIPDLANAVAQRKRIPLKDAEAFVKQFFDLVGERIVSDRLLKVKGLGTFKVVEVQERESINVNNGERIVIPGHMKVAFTPDAQLKNQVNRPFAVFQTVLLNENTPLEDMERLGPSADAVSSSQASDDEEETADLLLADENVALPDETGDVEPDRGDVADEMEDASSSDVPVAADEMEDASSSDVPEVADETVNPLMAEVPLSADETAHSESADVVSAVQPQPVQVVPAVSVAASPSPRWSFLRRLAAVVAILLLMAGCYMAGYYRIPDVKQIGAAFVPKPEVLSAVKATEPEPTEEPEPEESDEERALREAVDLYPQVPGGRYLIVGTKGVRQMKRGDTLLKMARQEYGHPDFARYIIVFNQFADPDVIPLGSDVNLPLLVEQTQLAAESSSEP